MIPIPFPIRWFSDKYDMVNLFLIILVRPSHLFDRALYAHEYTHTRQIFRTFGMHIWRYFKSAEYRYQAELEAYRNQMKHDYKPDVYARYLSSWYGLDVTYSQARKDLLK